MSGLSIAFIAVLAFGGTVLVRLGGPPQPATKLKLPPLGDTRTLLAPMGGVVAEVLAKRGTRVEAGQLLVKLEPGHGAVPESQIKTLASLIRRVPGKTWQSLVNSDPARLLAEQAYIDALASYEAAPTTINKGKLSVAERRREAAQRQIGELRPGTLSQLETDLRATAQDLRAPIAGRIEILDLHPGDKLAPFARIALISQ